MTSASGMISCHGPMRPALGNFGTWDLEDREPKIKGKKIGSGRIPSRWMDMNTWGSW